MGLGNLNPGCTCCEQCDIVASFTPTQTGTYPNYDWEFIDTSTTGCDGGVVSWAWDFGDGGTSTDENPTHEFPINEPGPWLVTLTVTDDCDCEDTVEMLVHRILSCTAAAIWARGEISTWDYVISGIADGTCLECNDLNVSNTTNNYAVGTDTWYRPVTGGTCTGGSATIDFQVNVGCGTGTPYGITTLNLRFRMNVPGGTVEIYADLGTAPTISTAVFFSPIIADEFPGGVRCDMSGASVTLTANI